VGGWVGVSLCVSVCVHRPLVSALASPREQLVLYQRVRAEHDIILSQSHRVGRAAVGGHVQLQNAERVTTHTHTNMRARACTHTDRHTRTPTHTTTHARATAHTRTHAQTHTRSRAHTHTTAQHSTITSRAHTGTHTSSLVPRTLPPTGRRVTSCTR
jgi:hypothetical protein